MATVPAALRVLLIGSGAGDAAFVAGCWLDLYGNGNLAVRSSELQPAAPSDETLVTLRELGVEARSEVPGRFSPDLLRQVDLVITLDDTSRDTLSRVSAEFDLRHWEPVQPAAATCVTLRQRCLDLARELALRPGGPGIERLSGPDHFEVLSTETAYRGFARLDVVHLRHRLYTGGWSIPLRREIVRRGPAVAVLMYDPDADQLVLIEQFRLAAAGDENGPWQLELVAGVIDPGESPEDVARREALEEAGCEIFALEPVCRYMASVGISTEAMHVYAGRVDARQAGGVHGLAAEGEDIRVCPVSSCEAFTMLADGRISNAATIIALQWLRLNRDALRARWLEQQ